MLIFPQDEHERLLIERLDALGRARRAPDRAARLRGRRRRASWPALRRPDGSEETCEAAYLAGCDGAHSTVRETLGDRLSRAAPTRTCSTSPTSRRRGPAIDGELHVALDDADFLAVFPLKGEGRARLIGTVRDERGRSADELSFDDVSHGAIEQLEHRRRAR